MPTDTTICNQALDVLGRPQLTLLGSDGTFEDDLCDAAFADVRDEVLRAHPWNTAVKRTILAENLLLQSAVFDNASWVKTNVTATANQIRSPQGDTEGDLLDDADAGNAGTVVQAVTVPNDSKNHTLSIYFKQGTASITRVTLVYSGGSGVTQNVDITWGATPTIDAGTIEDIGDGWWRLAITLLNNGSGNTTLTVTILPAGATASATGTVYAWGAQLSQNDGVVGYASTTTAAIQPIFPPFGYRFGWPLPADFIALIDVNEGDLNYKLEDGHLLTNDSDPAIRYEFQQTDAAKIDPLHRELIALRLAKRLAIPLSGSDLRKNEIKKDLMDAEARARSRDAQEDGEDKPVEDSWILARRGP